jgi:hypothetical protein
MALKGDPAHISAEAVTALTRVFLEAVKNARAAQ